MNKVIEDMIKDFQSEITGNIGKYADEYVQGQDYVLNDEYVQGRDFALKSAIEALKELDTKVVEIDKAKEAIQKAYTQVDWTLPGPTVASHFKQTALNNLAEICASHPSTTDLLSREDIYKILSRALDSKEIPTIYENVKFVQKLVGVLYDLPTRYPLDGEEIKDQVRLNRDKVAVQEFVLAMQKYKQSDVTTKIVDNITEAMEALLKALK